MNTIADESTPIDRPLLLSDLNDIRRCVHNIESVQLRWYEESKKQAEETAKLAREVHLLKQERWLPAIVSIVAAALAVLARVMP